ICSHSSGISPWASSPFDVVQSPGDDDSPPGVGADRPSSDSPGGAPWTVKPPIVVSWPGFGAQSKAMAGTSVSAPSSGTSGSSALSGSVLEPSSGTEGSGSQPRMRLSRPAERVSSPGASGVISGPTPAAVTRSSPLSGSDVEVMSASGNARTRGTASSCALVVTPAWNRALPVTDVAPRSMSAATADSLNANRTATSVGSTDVPADEVAGSDNPIDTFASYRSVPVSQR